VTTTASGESAHGAVGTKPVGIAVSGYSEHGLWEALLRLGPSFAGYLPSFTMLGTFWLAQHPLLSIHACS